MCEKKYLFDQAKVKNNLETFFKKEEANIYNFGRMVNQTFEAYVFAGVVKWYKKNGWTIHFKNPEDKYGKNYFRLKYSTRGAPSNYTYVVCEKNNQRIQIHHQLRIATKSYRKNSRHYANICCDVAIIKETDISFYKTYFAIPNENLISFAEAKHMSAFAELVANFIGMVHELKPDKLKRLRIKKFKNSHLPPFLYVSGILYQTAKGIEETIKRRKYDIDVYSYDKKLIDL
jgi:hypothetical protein